MCNQGPGRSQKTSILGERSLRTSRNHVQHTHIMHAYFSENSIWMQILLVFAFEARVGAGRTLGLDCPFVSYRIQASPSGSSSLSHRGESCHSMRGCFTNQVILTWSWRSLEQPRLALGSFLFSRDRLSLPGIPPTTDSSTSI